MSRQEWIIDTTPLALFDSPTKGESAGESMEGRTPVLAADRRVDQCGGRCLMCGKQSLGMFCRSSCKDRFVRRMWVETEKMQKTRLASDVKEVDLF